MKLALGVIPVLILVASLGATLMVGYLLVTVAGFAYVIFEYKRFLFL